MNWMQENRGRARWEHSVVKMESCESEQEGELSSSPLRSLLHQNSFLLFPPCFEGGRHSQKFSGVTLSSGPGATPKDAQGFPLNQGLPHQNRRRTSPSPPGHRLVSCLMVSWDSPTPTDRSRGNGDNLPSPGPHSLSCRSKTILSLRLSIWKLWDLGWPGSLLWCIEHGLVCLASNTRGQF